MPDLIPVIARRWKLMVSLTLAATLLSFFACLLTQKKYAGTATALAANPVLGDKARIFNQNIEALYTALGSPDELDRVEGAAKLDTLYLALADDFQLISHYGITETDTAALYKAAAILKKNTEVKRTGYGELRIKVWDKNNKMAAAIANAAMQKLNDIFQRLQTENNRVVLQRLKEEYTLKQQTLQPKTALPVTHKASPALSTDSARLAEPLVSSGTDALPMAIEGEQLAQYARLINEYELALKTAPNILLVVEYARPLPYPDKPNTAQVVLLAFVASLLFSVLLAVLLEGRNTQA